METRAKKKTYNIIMAALIVLIAVCGILAVGHIKGWFGGSAGGGSEIISQEIKGVANVERSGIGYSLEKDIEMQPADIIETKTDSEAVFGMGGNNTLSVNENSELEFSQSTEGSVRIVLREGEVFADTPKAPDSFNVEFGGNAAEITGTVFSVSQQKGSSMLTVYEGTVSVSAEDGSSNPVKAGQQLLITRNGDDKLTVDITDVKASSLSDYLIEKLLACGTDGLCFDEKDLNQITAQREKEKKAAAKALEQEAIAIAASEETGASADTASGSSGGNSSAASSGESGGSSASSGGSGSDVKTCTISIRCNAILKNMDKLKEGKNRYVPSNGVILATSSVEFRDGETAYDVTKRACSATGIQIEASYYVEGINHLYEFDCGEMSGWLYKVNGWAPNYGCSEYKLKNGDSIVWDYTCTGN